MRGCVSKHMSFNKISIKLLKSIRRMPRYKTPMKDVAVCEKPRIVDNKRFNPGMSEWGNPHRVMSMYF